MSHRIIAPPGGERDSHATDRSGGLDPRPRFLTGDLPDAANVYQVQPGYRIALRPTRHVRLMPDTFRAADLRQQVIQVRAVSGRIFAGPVALHPTRF
jgi:hypothetical protein